MHTFITIIHVFACIVLILVVLLQAGKGANMGAAFGGASQTVFGSSGAGTFLEKMTTLVAVIFMLTSLGLSFVPKEESVMHSLSSTVEKKSAQQIPTVPANTEKTKEVNSPIKLPDAKK